MQEQSFFDDTLQMYSQDWIRFDQHKKNSELAMHLLYLKKKTQEF